MTIIERIESKNAKIAKLETLIEKREAMIAKKSEKAEKQIDDERRWTLYDIERLEDEIRDRQRDIADLKKDIEDLQPMLQKFRDQQLVLENLRKVMGVFMDELEKSWNEYDERMLNEVTPKREEILKSLETKREELSSKLDAMSYEDANEEFKRYEEASYFNNGIRESRWSNEYWKKDICNQYASNVISKMLDKAMEKTFGVGYGKYIIHYYEKKDEKMAKFRADNHRSIESLVLDLQNRIAYKVGEITDYSGLHVDMKALNGIVKGTLGTCRVESILAGGYNIQRLHVRVLVK